MSAKTTVLMGKCKSLSIAFAATACKHTQKHTDTDTDTDTDTHADTETDTKISSITLAATTTTCQLKIMKDMMKAE